jgi:hypothetical protein
LNNSREFPQQWASSEIQLIIPEIIFHPHNEWENNY